MTISSSTSLLVLSASANVLSLETSLCRSLKVTYSVCTLHSLHSVVLCSRTELYLSHLIKHCILTFCRLWFCTTVVYEIFLCWWPHSPGVMNQVILGPGQTKYWLFLLTGRQEEQPLLASDRFTDHQWNVLNLTVCCSYIQCTVVHVLGQL